MSGDLKFEPDDIVKKEARGLDNADLGEVQGIDNGMIVTKKGIAMKNTYYFPRILIDRFDGQTLFLRVTDSDLKKYERT